MARINFVELPARDVGAAKAFYVAAFGWELAEFGPTYACTLTGDVDLGLQGDAAEATSAPLTVIAVDDLEVALGAVKRAGGRSPRKPSRFPVAGAFTFAIPAATN